MALLIGVQGELHLERQSWFHAVGKLLSSARSLAFCGTEKFFFFLFFFFP
jgi:hypothetical protein